MGTARIGSSNIISLDVGELTLDSDRMPLAIVQKRAGDCPKTMSRDLLVPESEPPERRMRGIVSDGRSAKGSLGRRYLPPPGIGSSSASMSNTCGVSGTLRG